jgi:aminoglycoside/choline kinase family phosphotransferase
MTLNLLIDRTRQRFPHYHDSTFDIRPLEKGGSDRKYYRIRFSADSSLILVKYQKEKPENVRFVAVANFLDGIGVNAPLIYFHDDEEGLIWMQDLGEEDLWHHRTEAWPIRKFLYERTLYQVITLHRTDPSLARMSDSPPDFDAALYRWEQEYGLQNCFRRCFRVSVDRIQTLWSRPELIQLADELARHPRVLVHRDLQSQNIIISDDEAFLIDFQGMRPGLGEYDLASLLYDPYVNLTDAEREALLSYYLERLDSSVDHEQFRDIFLRCAIQRLLQALGAYGVIGVLRGKPEFLRHISPAINSLRQVASALPSFKFFIDFLDELPATIRPVFPEP